MRDFQEFLAEGYTAQQKYAEANGELGPCDLLPQQQRNEKIIEYMGHLMEELHEARVYVPRRSWKREEACYNNSKEMRREFIAELYDIQLFFRAIIAYAGINPSEFIEIAEGKDAYNKVRPDHNVNVNASEEFSPSHPLDELRGNCPSSNFNS